MSGHVLHRLLDENVAYPPHEPRTESPTYRATHQHLVYALDAPCWICGIRHSQGGQMETHHYRFEWASQFGLDLEKVTADFPALSDRDKLAEWVDSESNMLVLCARHHRAKYEGIHEISYPAWLLQRYQGADWTFIAQHIENHTVRAHTPLLAVVPLAEGGTHDPENLTAACRRCNARKRTVPLLRFLLRA